MYTAKEVLEMQLGLLTAQIAKTETVISREVGEVRDLIRDQNVQIEKRAVQNDTRFQKIDEEMRFLTKAIEELKLESAKQKGFWSIIGTFGGAIAGLITAYTFNRIF